MVVVEIFGKALLLGLMICLAAPEPEPMEDTSYNFWFDSHGRYLVAISLGNSSTCYMAKLTRNEAGHAHTDQGLKDLQVKMTQQWIGSLPQTRVYKMAAALPGTTQDYCSRHEIYVLERTAGGQSTVQHSNVPTGSTQPPRSPVP